jgi:hypothetical protein
MSFQPLRLVIERREDDLPPCPAIEDGVAVRYMGTERRRVEGEGTGFVYFADPNRRLFIVDRRDLAGVLTLRAFVLAE